MTLLRSPSLHFFALGIVVFVAATAAERHAANAPAQIVVTQTRIDQLTADFAALHRRGPSADEQAGLIRDYVHEEVSVREALALGLDRDDAVIRNRLREKVEFLFADVASKVEPTEAQLAAYLRQHAGAFQSEAHFSFDQVYLDPQRRSTTLARDAAQLLAELDAGGAGQDGSSSGDPFLLDRRFDDIARSEVSALFGGRFAATLNDLTVGRWQGPIESGYGVHLIRVRRYIPARVPTLDEVRDAVRLECINAERQRTRQRFYDGLLARYAVTVEPPNAAAQGELASAQ
jgi:hypothetical protein